MLHYNARVKCAATFMEEYNELFSTNQNRILTLAILENSIYTVKSYILRSMRNSKEYLHFFVH